ncbi:hypothetical protein Peur_061610 [Populus x canadensis]
MTRAAVWCFKVEDVKSRNRFSRPETMRSISQKYQNLFLKRGTWDPDEDQKLRAYIKRHGIWNWNEMPRAAAKLPGRTDNDIKNFWNTHVRNRFNNNISNTTVQAPKLQGIQTSEEEFKQRKSSAIDVSLPTATKILNSEEYSSKGTLPVLPILFSDNFSSSSSTPVNDINENMRTEENNGSFESFAELSFLDQPLSMEAQKCNAEDYGEAYIDEMWVQELLNYPNASHNFDVGQEFWINCLMQAQLNRN